MLLQSALLHSKTLMLSLVTVSHKAITKYLRRTGYINNTLGDHTAGQRFCQGKLKVFFFQKIDHCLFQCLALICCKNILTEAFLQFFYNRFDQFFAGFFHSLHSLLHEDVLHRFWHKVQWLDWSGFQSDPGSPLLPDFPRYR